MKTIIKFSFLSILFVGCDAIYYSGSGYEDENNSPGQITLVSYHSDTINNNAIVTSNNVSNSRLTDYEIYAKNKENELYNQSDPITRDTINLNSQQENSNVTNNNENDDNEADMESPDYTNQDFGYYDPFSLNYFGMIPGFGTRGYILG